MLYLDRERETVTKSITETPINIYVLKEICKKSFLMDLSKKYIEKNNIKKFKILTESRTFLESNWELVFREFFKTPEFEQFLLDNITEDDIFLWECDRNFVKCH